MEKAGFSSEMFRNLERKIGLENYLLRAFDWFIDREVKGHRQRKSDWWESTLLDRISYPELLLRHLHRRYKFDWWLVNQPREDVFWVLRPRKCWLKKFQPLPAEL